MDNLQEPLLSEAEQRGEQQPDDVADVSQEPGKAQAVAGPGTVVVLLTIAAGIAGLLFGCKKSVECQDV